MTKTMKVTVVGELLPVHSASCCEVWRRQGPGLASVLRCDPEQVTFSAALGTLDHCGLTRQHTKVYGPQEVLKIAQ